MGEMKRKIGRKIRNEDGREGKYQQIIHQSIADRFPSVSCLPLVSSHSCLSYHPDS